MLRLLGLLLPALFPSWRFFREVGPSPRVEVQVDGGPWSEVMPVPARMPIAVTLRRLVWSPAENERLFLVSLADRILTEPRDCDVDELIRQIARFMPRASRFRFRLCLVSGEGTCVAGTSEVFLVAEVLL